MSRPLAYHAVSTIYSDQVRPEERYTLLCGTFFADVRLGSLWRELISVWMRGHQTGYRHESKKRLLKKYVKFFISPGITRRSSKRQRRKDKASEAIRKR